MVSETKFNIGDKVRFDAEEGPTHDAIVLKVYGEFLDLMYFWGGTLKGVPANNYGLVKSVLTTEQPNE
jgi:hypothetical protein